MAKTFRPKEVLREAELAEKAGNARVASKLFHALSIHALKSKRLEEAYQMLERAIALSAKSARLYVLKAKIADQMGLPEEVQASLRAFISYSLEKGKLQEYTTYLEDQLKDLPKVRQVFFEGLLKIERTTSLPFLGLARALFDQGDFQRVRSVLLDCLKTKDQIPRCLAQLRSVLLAQKVPQAIGFVDKYEAGELTHEELTALLGVEGEKKVQLDLTEVPVEKDLKSLIADLENELGITLEKDLDAVKPLVHEFRKRAEAIVEGDSKSRLDLSLAFYEMGLFQDALEEAKSVPESDPLYPDVLLAMAKIYIAQGADLAALNHCQQVSREARASSEHVKEALYSSAEIYHRMGDLKKALETAVKLEKMDPNYRQIHRMKIHIEDQMHS